MEMYVEVLGAVYMGCNKLTQIMYRAGLSYSSLSDLLPRMIDLELLTENKSSLQDKRTKHQYYITNKGVNVIKYMTKAKELLSIENTH